MKRRVLIIAGIVALIFALLCGFGGYALYSSLNDSANQLGPEFERAEKNQIPLTQQDLRPEYGIPPNQNAALLYKDVFDQWVNLRPQIDDDRWQTFINSSARTEDTDRVLITFAPLVGPFQAAIEQPSAQWSIDYSDHAFSSYPVFPAIVDAAILNINISDQEQNSRGEFTSYLAVEQTLRSADHILASNDPGSLRTAAAIRSYVLKRVADDLPNIYKNRDERQVAQKMLAVLESVADIDPLPVWRTTAFLQLDTWESYKNLTPEQQELFAVARRDHDVIINAASTEILSFWNTALEEAKGKPALTQYITLGEQVRILRERTDPAAFPLIKLWTLESATHGAGSMDWIVANEQLQLTRQALDVLVPSKDQLPQKFDCKRISVIGQKPYTYEKTSTGFKLSATPSDILAPDSALAQQSLIYEFKTK